MLPLHQLKVRFLTGTESHDGRAEINERLLENTLNGEEEKETTETTSQGQCHGILLLDGPLKEKTKEHRLCQG